MARGHCGPLAPSPQSIRPSGYPVTQVPVAWELDENPKPFTLQSFSLLSASFTICWVLPPVQLSLGWIPLSLIGSLSLRWRKTKMLPTKTRKKTLMSLRHLMRCQQSTEAHLPTTRTCMYSARNKSYECVALSTESHHTSACTCMERVEVNWLIYHCYSATSSSSPCWASRVPSSSAGKFFFRGSAAARTSHYWTSTIITDKPVKRIHVCPDRWGNCSTFLGLHRGCSRYNSGICEPG